MFCMGQDFRKHLVSIQNFKGEETKAKKKWQFLRIEFLRFHQAILIYSQKL